jgi:hypothetical protein
MKVCEVCKKKFHVKPSHFQRRKYCSVACMSDAYKGRPAWNKGKRCPWADHLAETYCKGKTPWNKGVPQPEEQRRKNSIVHLGLHHSAEARHKMSVAHKGKKLTLEHRKKIALARGGSHSNFWRGGMTSVRQKIYNSGEYRAWRTAVFERDNYTCVWCGVRGGRLEADHIKPFSVFPALRFEVANGRTLCKPCHQKTPTYGARIQKICALTNVPLPDPEAAGYISNS